MTARHIMDARARASKKYRETHEKLRREVYGDQAPTLAAKSPKQIRKFAKSELFRLHSENI